MYLLHASSSRERYKDQGISMCVGLFVRGLGGAGQGGGERRAASARSATKRGDGDVHGGSVHGAAPVAAPRSGGGALSEAGCPAQPAGNAPDGGAKKIEREFTVG